MMNKNLSNIYKAAVEQKPVKLQKAFKSEARSRIQNTLIERKKELAQSMFSK